MPATSIALARRHPYSLRRNAEPPTSFILSSLLLSSLLLFLTPTSQQNINTTHQHETSQQTSQQNKHHNRTSTTCLPPYHMATTSLFHQHRPQHCRHMSVKSISPCLPASMPSTFSLTYFQNWTLIGDHPPQLLRRHHALDPCGLVRIGSLARHVSSSMLRLRAHGR